MSHLHAIGLFLVGALAAACGGQVVSPAPTGVATPPAATQPPSTPPAVSEAPTSALPSPDPATAEPTAEPPTEAPSLAPGASLDPLLSDAGVVGRMTIDGAERDPGEPRNGTHDVIGAATDGSSCTTSFDGAEYAAVAYDTTAPAGSIRQMFVVVPAEAIPAAVGETSLDIADGRAGADFGSETGFGTLYYGDATEPDEGSATIDVTRYAYGLVFDFEGVTWDGVTFSGQMVCDER